MPEEAEGDDPDYTEIADWGVDEHDNIYALNWWYGMETQDIWVDHLMAMAKIAHPHAIVGETGVIRRTSEPYIKKTMKQTGDYYTLRWLPTIGDKFARARTFQALAKLGKVYFPRTEWAERVIRQLVKFPGTRYDDAVDACGLIGRAINQTWAARVPQPRAVVPIDARPTLNELMEMNDRKPKPINRRI